MYAFGSSDNFSATGLSQEQGNQIKAEVHKNIASAFKDYPLSNQNLSAIQAKYISKLKTVMNLKTKIEKKDKANPIVEITAITVNTNLAKMASNDESLLALGYEMRQRQNEGATLSALKTDAQFQNIAMQAINNFIDRLPVNSVKTFEVACKIVKGDDGKNYYAPADPSALKNFLATNFVIEINDGQEQFEQFFGFVTAPIDETPQKEISDTYGKNDKWLIYWYVCGTDIETNRMFFTQDTNFETGRIVIGNQDNPGDVTLCIREVEKANISDNVEIFAQFGGTLLWGHEKFQNLNAIVQPLEKSITNYSDGTLQFESYNGNYTKVNVLKNSKIGRYLYGKNKRDWTPINTLDITGNPHSKTDMGSKEGLIDFLDYAKKNIEPQYKSYIDTGKFHRVFIFVDHGSGSVGGVCLDPYTKNTIGINDIKTAFNSVYGSSEKNPPFEVVAFDTCLMSTYETAVALKGISKYMVGSQESIFGKVMFEYTGLLNQLSQNPAMNGAQLGKVICETYKNDCINTGRKLNYPDFEKLMTMSVVEIDKVKDIENAYENFGKIAKSYADKNFVNFYSIFSGVAKNSEQYGVDIKDDGTFVNGWGMVDLRSLAEEVKNDPRINNQFPNLSQASDTLISTINNAVIYNIVRGSALSRGGGLSTYYPYTNSHLQDYKNLAKFKLTPQSMSNLYEEIGQNTGFTQNISQGESKNTNAVKIKPGSPFDFSDFNQRIIPHLNYEEKTASINIDPEVLKLDNDNLKIIPDYVPIDTNIINRIAGVRCQVINVQNVKGNDNKNYMVCLFLGQNADIESDWELGEFTSKFRGDWLQIDGNPVYVYIASEATRDTDGNKRGSDLYLIPILLNGQFANLLFSYDYSNNEYSIIGARPESNAVVPVSEIYGLKKGDVVTPIFMGVALPWEILKTENETAAEQLYKDFEKLSEELKAVGDDQEKLAAILEKNPTAQNYLFRYDASAFTIGDTVKIENSPLGNGHYAYVFEFINPIGGYFNNAYSNLALFTVKNGELILRDDTDIENPEDLDEVQD